MIKTLTSSALAILVLGTAITGCSEKKEESSVTQMKCGAGKCGANMFNGSSALEKKKRNILKQMREDDSRKDCVINAKTSKATYDCVREPKGKKLTLKCGSTKKVQMKCGANKCGASMEEDN